MTVTKRTFATALAVFTFTVGAVADERTPRPLAERVSADGPAVDLALALDVSDSMDPLLDAARLTLWDVVSEAAAAEPAPDLRVALLTYGGHGGRADAGWVIVASDFTRDLDRIAELLFDARTGGGREYVARAVATAAEQLAWSDDADGVRMIVVAGNEAADQDPDVSLQRAAYAALDHDIAVHAVFCGNAQAPAAASWRELAKYAEGGFAAIGRDAGVPASIATPHDEELVRLGRALAATVVPLGKDGRERFERLERQDERTLRLSPAAAAARATAEARSAAGWDLVTRAERGADLAQLDPSDLPEALQHLSLEQLAAELERRAHERRELRLQIDALGRLRLEHLARELADAGSERPTFGTVLRNSVREAMQDRGFVVERPE